MKKVYYDDAKTENKEWLPARIFLGILFIIVLLHMFVFKSGDGSLIHTETLWKAVHPFNWFFDGIALIAFTWILLFISGLAGKIWKGIYNVFQPGENNFGASPLMIGACVLLMLLFFA